MIWLITLNAFVLTLVAILCLRVSLTQPLNNGSQQDSYGEREGVGIGLHDAAQHIHTGERNNG